MIKTDEKYELVVSCITENQDSLYRLALSYTKDRQSALDVVQNTVLRALESYERLRNSASVKPWLFKIAVNESNRYMAKNKREIPSEPSELPEEAYIEKAYEKGEGNAVCEAVMHLPEDMKTVVILRYFEDMSLKEVAMATVEISSPSSLPASTPALCMALSAQGTLRLERLPVTKPR